jgi:hypothetical protein
MLLRELVREEPARGLSPEDKPAAKLLAYRRLPPASGGSLITGSSIVAPYVNGSNLSWGRQSLTSLARFGFRFPAEIRFPLPPPRAKPMWPLSIRSVKRFFIGAGTEPSQKTACSSYFLLVAIQAGATVLQRRALSRGKAHRIFGFGRSELGL